MATVIVQLGQCGNQIGDALWPKLLQNRQAKQAFCHRDGMAACVAIDSESKVVRSLLTGHAKYPVRQENAIYSNCSFANNWSYGYRRNGDNMGLSRRQACALEETCRTQETLLDRSVECIRKEVERCDCFSSVLFVHSLIGGTGGGFGSRLVETLRDVFPLPYFLSTVVAPYSTGESSVQHYNSLLCLAYLQKYVDGVVMFKNDSILQCLAKLHKENRSSTQTVTIQQINDYLADSIFGLLAPTETSVSPPCTSLGTEPAELVRSLCPMPGLKFLESVHVSTNKISCNWPWEGLANRLLQTVPRRNYVNGYRYYSLGNLLVFRGNTSAKEIPISKIEAKCKQMYSTVSWNPYPVDIWTDTKRTSPDRLKSFSLTSCANYSSCIDYFINVVDNARQMYNAKAYLHWYSRYGCNPNSIFEDAFEQLDCVIDNYRQAVTE